MAKIEIPQLKDGVAVQANKYMEAGNRIAPAHPIISRASGPRVCWYFLMYVRLSLEIRKLSEYKKLPKQAFLNQVTEYSKETSCSVIMVNNKNKRKLRKSAYTMVTYTVPTSPELKLWRVRKTRGIVLTECYDIRREKRS